MMRFHNRTIAGRSGAYIQPVCKWQACYLGKGPVLRRPGFRACSECLIRMTFYLRQRFCVCLIFSGFVAVRGADFAWKSAGPGIETLSVTNSRPSPVLFTAVRISRVDFGKKFTPVT